MKLSIVIASYNEDPARLTATLRNIRDTCGDRVEIVLVDDASNTPLSAIVPKELNVRLVANVRNCGVGSSRTIGVCHALGEYVLILDGHMTFPQANWLDAALERIEGRPTTVHCAVCVDADRKTSAYSGATFNVAGPDRNAKGKYQVFECVWLPSGVADDAQVPAVMGACYFIPRRWFLALQPLRCLRSWGGDETMLSLKSYLAGGDCRLLGNVRIGHHFWPSGKLPYRIPTLDMIWNKLFAIYTLTDPTMASSLVIQLPRQYSAKETLSAMEPLRREWRTIATEQAFNRTIFRRSFRQYMEQFGLTLST